MLKSQFNKEKHCQMKMLTVLIRKSKLKIAYRRLKAHHVVVGFSVCIKKWRNTGKKTVLGHFEATGVNPICCRKMKDNGAAVDQDWFRVGMR